MQNAKIIPRFAALLFTVCLLFGCATADFAQTADSATTAIALQSGFSEGNPIFNGAAWPVIAGVKFGVTQVAKTLPDPYCEAALFGLTIGGFGAAIWNIGVLAGSCVVAIPIIAVSTLVLWDTWSKHAKRDCIEAKEFINSMASDEQ